MKSPNELHFIRFICAYLQTVLKVRCNQQVFVLHQD